DSGGLGGRPWSPHQGGSCAPSGTPSSVFVGPLRRSWVANVSGTTRVEAHATVVNGTITGGRIGALSPSGQNGSGIQAGFNVSGPSSSVVSVSEVTAPPPMIGGPTRSLVVG